MWFVCRSGNMKTSLQQPSTSFFSPSSATTSRHLVIKVMCLKWKVVEKKCFKWVSLPSTWSGRQGTCMSGIYPKIAGKLAWKIILPGKHPNNTGFRWIICGKNAIFYTAINTKSHKTTSSVTQFMFW